MQLRLLVLIAVTFAPLTLIPDCCSDRHYAIGQESQATLEPITLVESKSFVWDGFANARVVDGKVIADVTSKPKFVGATSQIVLSWLTGMWFRRFSPSRRPRWSTLTWPSRAWTVGRLNCSFRRRPGLALIASR